MTDLHLSCFLNHDRPKIQHSDVTMLPIVILGSPLSSKLELSLKVSISDNNACALSARLWEDILEQHRVPYLLLRVADMRMTLSSKFTALLLYEELQAKLHDEGLDEWIKHIRVSIIEETEQQLNLYKYDARLGFTPSQRWRSTAASDPFSYCKLQHAQIDMIRSEWMNMGHHPQAIMDRFINFHCLETNVMEGTLQFNDSVSAKLVQVGFFNQLEPVDEQSLIGGAVRSCADALSILQDTHQALGEIFKLVNNDSPTLTVETICRLHRILMSTSRVLNINTPHGPLLSYTNIGITRQTSRVNVTAISSDQNLKIQFCPYDQVDDELMIFCDRFNQLLRLDYMDPFAAAAWINHIFVTIHPFEDGNGRLSRILASIPLLKHQLPPLCIPSIMKKPYYQSLNFVRATRDGDYSGLMKNLYNGTKVSLILLSDLIDAESVSVLHNVADISNSPRAYDL